ncbi:hypothetical protein HYW20_07595 [Candidatus Woesearchaeota archaeon]|nr:hypothetical protein [Candidatus Woesearchaeota archaeon]
MQGLSKKEIEIVSWLEFNEKYFFTGDDIQKFSKSKTQRYNIIKRLIKKKRIVKLNRRKYYLIPIKAKSGSWSVHPFAISHEACDGKNYFIGGWAAAEYWKLTDQIPMQVDVFTTRRQGKLKVLNAKIFFHRTTKKRVENAVIKDLGGYLFRIEKRQRAKKWLKSRS